MKPRPEQPILSTIAAPIVILLIVCAVLAFWIGRLRRQTEWVSHTLEVLYQTQAAESAAIQQMLELRGYMLTGAPGHLARLDTLTRSEESILGHLQRLTMDNASQQARILRLRATYSRLAQLIGEERQRLGSSPPVLLSAEERASLASRQNQVIDLQRQFSAVTAEERRLLTIRQQQERRTSSILYGTLALTAVVVGVGMLLFLRARIATIRGTYETLLQERDASAAAERQARLTAEALAEDVKARLDEAQQALLDSRSR